MANSGYLALENALKPFLVLMERYFRGASMARVRGLTIESSDKTTGKTSQCELKCFPRTELSKLHRHRMRLRSLAKVNFTIASIRPNVNSAS